MIINFIIIKNWFWPINFYNRRHGNYFDGGLNCTTDRKQKIKNIKRTRIEHKGREKKGEL